MSASSDGQHAHLDQLGHDRRHAAGAVIFLAEEAAGRLQVEEQRDVEADPLPVVVVERTPRCLAMALRWIGALVEPPIAELMTMAFSNAARVMICEGFRSSHTISTMRLPVR